MFTTLDICSTGSEAPPTTDHSETPVIQADTAAPHEGSDLAPSDTSHPDGRYSHNLHMYQISSIPVHVHCIFSSPLQ